MTDSAAELQLGLTGQLARVIVAARSQRPDRAQRDIVRRIVLDWFAVTLAGQDEPVSRLTRDEFGGNGRGASIVGFELQASPADAAMVNGATAHALDYDDVRPDVGHPGAVIVSAALAVAEAHEASDELFLRAVIAGYDAALFVGKLVMPGHYTRGFHSTGTVCAFGAAAASAVVMSLDEAQTAIALGLAGTQAAGLKSMFGTMAKPFHAGRAAAAGIVAARLAAGGMTANPMVLEAPQGFIATQAAQGFPVDWRPPAYGEGLKGVRFKFHASCYLSHPAIELTRGLRDRHGLHPKDIATVSLRVHPGHLAVCNIAEPRTGTEVKFSLRQLVALALNGADTAAPGTFSDARARDPAIIALRDCVTVHGDWHDQFGAQAEVILRNGDRVREVLDCADVTIAGLELERRLIAKFRALTRPVVGHEAASELERLITALASGADISLNQLIDAARPGIPRLK